jgi:hypothetical protein
MADKKDIWLNSAVTPRLLGSEYIGDYNDALQELRKVASKMAPEGRLVTFVSSSSEKFRPIEKLAANLAMSKTIYNERSITSNPEIGVELSSIIEHVNAINKIIDKRKAKLKGSKKKG